MLKPLVGGCYIFLGLERGHDTLYQWHMKRVAVWVLALDARPQGSVQEAAPREVGEMLAGTDTQYVCMCVVTKLYINRQI